MSFLYQALSDYLAVRRKLGYKLEGDGKLLHQFLTYLEGLGEKHVSTQSALAWAQLPGATHRSWLSNRLTIVRGFAIYLKSIDPKTEIPPSDLLPWKRCRATPYLYSKEEVLALISAAKTLKFPHLAATFQTLIGLLTVTGMRISEAIHLDREDFDSNQKLLTVREGKFGKSRILPLHSSTARALRDYLSRRDQPRLVANTSALLISSVGKRLSPSSVQETFRKLRRKAGLKPRSASCRPRIHDFRHSFAVNTLLESYRSEEDPGTKLPLLSTYLGHVDPKNTYWYLSAAPELMKLAGNRLERHLGGAL